MARYWPLSMVGSSRHRSVRAMVDSTLAQTSVSPAVPMADRIRLRQWRRHPRGSSAGLRRAEDPALGWLVIDHPTEVGGGCTEWPHHPRGCPWRPRDSGTTHPHINPDSATNGGTAPHLHLSVMPREYNPNAKIDPGAVAGRSTGTTSQDDLRPGYQQQQRRGGPGPGQGRGVRVRVGEGQ